MPGRMHLLGLTLIAGLAACDGKPAPPPAPTASVVAPKASAAGRTFAPPTFGVAACDRFATVLAACAPELAEADFTTAKDAVDDTWRSYRQSVATLGAERTDAAFAKSCSDALPRVRGAFAATCPDAGWDH